MFTSKGLFSAIPCPYPESCIQSGCIFAHLKKPISPELADEPEKKDQSIDEQSSIKEDINLKPRQPREASTPPVSTSRGLLVGKPVSPPPIRRQHIDGSTPLSSSSITNNSSPKPQVKIRAVPNPAQTPVKQTIKKEGLNPRALKIATSAKHEFRFRLLKALHEHFVRLNSELAKDANDEEEKLVSSDQELITKALDLEESASSTPSIYGNVMKNKILAYKRMSVIQWKEEKALELKKATAMAAPAPSTGTSRITGPPISTETGLSSEAELNLLHKLHTPVSGLSKHGYVTSIPTAEEVEAAKKGIEAAKGWENCDRCKSRFQVFPGRREEDGALTSGGTCTYHYGKPYWVDQRTAQEPRAPREKRFRCCNQSMGDSAGCTTSACHVFKATEVKRMAAILNFEKTPANMEKISDRPVCIDGEMGYTVHGMELIRLTATSWPAGTVIFDVLVRPFGEILDLNSRYSGVLPKDMADAPAYSPSSPSTSKELRIVPSPAAARALLFSHITPSTPLIGHGLENDLNALRTIHPTLIDTALLYPHNAGLPYRNGLKALTEKHLNRVIQDAAGGHDSKEDANAAGDLVRLRLKQEWETMKKDGWTVEFGIFSAPLLSPETAATSKRGRERVELEDCELEINYG